MIYLSGAVRAELPAIGIGYMLTPMMGNAPDLSTATWGADTGCFAKPEAYSEAGYLKWLGERAGKGRCLFATAPDVVGNAATTLDRSMPVLPMLRRLGYPAALVAQDGLESLVIPWDAFDVLFIGGSTEWKLSAVAAGIVAEAKARGKWVHMGRVNSWRRLQYAASIGCDSADGTFLAFGPAKNLPRLRSWIRRLAAGHQPTLSPQDGANT